MPSSPSSVDVAGPTWLDAASLLADVADSLVVATVRDTHQAIARRVHHVVNPATGGAAALPERAHTAVAGAIYAGLGAGLRGASRGLDAVAAHGVGPGLEVGPRGRFATAAINGLIGDSLLRDRPQWAIPLAVRVDGRDVAPEREALAAAFPEATGQVAVFLHGLCENESYWNFHRKRTGTTYPEAVAGLGYTPVLLRANTGLSLRENGVALTALMRELVENWPVEVSRIVVVGHSLGGLVLRAAGAVEQDHGWTTLVTNVITLGTPHRGAPLARGVGQGSRALRALPETAAFGRILEWRSVGVRDLVEGLDDDVAALPHARYHLISATLTASPRHPVGRFVGDLLVRPRSAIGRDLAGRELFPGAETLHLGNTDHFGLLNHAEVHARLPAWLA